MTNEAAIIILSGGQDSTTCLFWAKAAGFDPIHALTFDYGQRHRREIEAARTVAQMAGVASHEVLELGPILQGTSPLTDPAQRLETYKSFEDMAATIGDRVELTFVPMRNALFLTIAANRGVVLGARHLVSGVCQEDNANYPDCRRDFVDAHERMISFALGRKPGDHVVIHTPLMRLTKTDTVHMAYRLPGCWDALAWTHTAYSGEFPPVTRDHATMLRAQGFADAQLPDPLIVRAWRAGLMELPATANYDQLRRAA